MFSPLLDASKLPQDSQELKSKLAKNALSELPDFISGKFKLNVPVYCIYGASEDLTVIEKFNNGTYSVPNLFLVDETKTHAIETASGHVIRLMGLGGSLVLHRFFDNGDGTSTIAGTHGLMWTTALQIGQLIQTVRKSFDASEIRIFISHPCPSREGLLLALAIALRADFTVSSGLHFIYGSSFNAFTAEPTFESFKAKLVAARAQFMDIWENVKVQVLSLLEKDTKQRLLLQSALEVFERMPTEVNTGETPARTDYLLAAYRNMWNFNLCDAEYGSLVLNVVDGRVSVEAKSQGFDFKYRKNNSRGSRGSAGATATSASTGSNTAVSSANTTGTVSATTGTGAARTDRTDRTDSRTGSGAPGGTPSGPAATSKAGQTSAKSTAAASTTTATTGNQKTKQGLDTSSAKTGKHANTDSTATGATTPSNSTSSNNTSNNTGARNSPAAASASPSAPGASTPDGTSTTATTATNGGTPVATESTSTSSTTNGTATSTAAATEKPATSSTPVPEEPQQPGIWISNGHATEDEIKAFFTDDDKSLVTNIEIKESFGHPDKKFALVHFPTADLAKSAMEKMDKTKAGRVSLIGDRSNSYPRRGGGHFFSRGRGGRPSRGGSSSSTRGSRSAV
ncbi:hypothetical protein AWJ20_5145 [Sugiyamaella lignohabitans]|uniref:DUF2433 domain-containing protein n=1 Tax=Sugiyamaella lignohabitans TaxID=796027 RepID=A0A167EKL5_9ASCO|nr:uncharacterized protein AWJ20_5145 [Sugiyamaella lignohabitans]ANB14186.1 hypothetical protein AWJ20_5145 [Sugiyamaella lignohabitans]